MYKHIFFGFILIVACILFPSCDNPRKAFSEIEKGINLAYQSRFKEAEACFDKAIKYDKDSYEAYYRRGTVKFNQHKWDEAIVDYMKAIEIKSDYADPYFNLGNIYSYRNDYDKSCYYYKKAEEYGRQNMDDYVRNCP
ncbi:MAG: tetratricopeptide repeat protein [Lentimicrobiaceae bacterium]|jgi:tetratricopeptide (TPR) repeat protein|nr:tetratricopeptide repeat protein [Lentimicrobiaceae bacterium]